MKEDGKDKTCKKEIPFSGKKPPEKLKEDDMNMVVGGMTLMDRCTQGYSVGVCHLASLDGVCRNLICDRYESDGFLMLRVYFNCSKGYFYGVPFDMARSDEALRKITNMASRKC